MPVATPQFFVSWQQFGSPAFNCSAVHEPGDWWSANRGQQRLALGAWSIAFGAVSLILYFACAHAMLPFRDRVCYKIMFWLAVVDIIAVYVNSISLGILFIQGAVYCTYPLYNFLTGCTAVGAWCGASIGGLVLVLNRMRALLGKEGWIEHSTRSLLLLTSCYGLYFTLFTPPGVINSKFQTFLFTPVIYDSDEFAYHSIPHVFNNIVIVSLSTLLYAAFLILLIHKSILIQASLICLINVTASAMFAYMNFIEATFSLVQVAQICWQLSHGMPPFIYLFLNRTIRGIVINQLWRHNKITPLQYSNGVTPPQILTRRSTH